MTMNETSITSQQLTSLHTLGDARIAKMGLTKDVFQLAVLEKGGDFQDGYELLIQQMVDAYRDAIQPYLLPRKPFDPKKFFDGDWSIINPKIKQRVGDTLDASKIITKHYQEQGGSYTYGTERLHRIKLNPNDIQLDAADFFALRQEENHVTLNWLCKTKGITFLSFWGTILQNSTCDRYVLCLICRGGYSWDWDHVRVDSNFWIASRPSGVLELPAENSVKVD
jgi:hypothetical protein